MKRLAVLLAGGVALLVAAAFVFGRPAAWVQASLIMWDIAAGGERTLWQTAMPPPQERLVRWPDGEGDLYLPAGDVRAAMVLVPGAAVLGRDEPRLKALARTFARAGFAVVVPELPELRRLALSRVDADRVAAALRYLGSEQPAVPLEGRGDGEDVPHVVVEHHDPGPGQHRRRLVQLAQHAALVLTEAILGEVEVERGRVDQALR